jgi:hypothetical protein
VTASYPGNQGQQSISQRVAFPWRGFIFVRCDCSVGLGTTERFKGIVSCFRIDKACLHVVAWWVSTNHEKNLLCSTLLGAIFRHVCLIELAYYILKFIICGTRSCRGFL